MRKLCELKIEKRMMDKRVGLNKYTMLIWRKATTKAQTWDVNTLHHILTSFSRLNQHSSKILCCHVDWADSIKGYGRQTGVYVNFRGTKTKQDRGLRGSLGALSEPRSLAISRYIVDFRDY